MTQHDNQGFTIVELVVTLGVALLFLSAGFMLYQLIISRSTAAEWQLKASGIANSYITEQKDNMSASCSPGPLTVPPIPAGSLPGNPHISAEITCPYGAGSSLNRLTVTVSQSSTGTSNIGQEVIRARDFDAINN